MTAREERSQQTSPQEKSLLDLAVKPIIGHWIGRNAREVHAPSMGCLVLERSKQLVEENRCQSGLIHEHGCL
jgi:hypothetical protein